MIGLDKRRGGQAARRTMMSHARGLDKPGPRWRHGRIASAAAEERTDMRRYLNAFAMTVLVLLLGGCQSRPATEPSAPLPRDHAGATLYTIDALASRVTVRVYRDGPLARFGHNHVIALRQLQGRVFVHRELSRSGFELSAPLAAMAVDQPADRMAAGADFPGELPADAIAGTRANMLGPKLLAADQHPLLELNAVAVRGQWPDLIFSVRVSVGGNSNDVEFPARVAVN